MSQNEQGLGKKQREVLAFIRELNGEWRGFTSDVRGAVHSLAMRNLVEISGSQFRAKPMEYEPTRVRDLINQTGEPGPHPILYCEHCDAEYSANAGDYWHTSKNEIMRCGACEKSLLLVFKQTSYREEANTW